MPILMIIPHCLSTTDSLPVGNGTMPFRHRSPLDKGWAEHAALLAGLSLELSNRTTQEPFEEGNVRNSVTLDYSFPSTK